MPRPRSSEGQEATGEEPEADVLGFCERSHQGESPPVRSAGEDVGRSVSRLRQLPGHGIQTLIDARIALIEHLLEARRDARAVTVRRSMLGRESTSPREDSAVTTAAARAADPLPDAVKDPNN